MKIPKSKSASVERTFKIPSNTNEQDAKPIMTTPATNILYQSYDGSFQLECDARVLSCQMLEDATINICLNQTALHAQGGGQPTDKGEIVLSSSSGDDAIIEVAKVLLDRATGVVTHIGVFKNDDSVMVSPGDTVHVKVDEGNRQLMSECHSGGHVVDAAMVRAGIDFKPIKGYHFIDGPYVEYKGTIAAEERAETLKKLQSTFQEIVSEEIETKIEVLPKQEAKECCSRLAENFGSMSGGDEAETVRIVTVAGLSCPCGGTHIKNTGVLKKRKWGIIGLKCKKGMVRVKYGQNWDA